MIERVLADNTSQPSVAASETRAPGPAVPPGPCPHRRSRQPERLAMIPRTIFSETYDQFRGTVRRFVERELVPHRSPDVFSWEPV